MSPQEPDAASLGRTRWALLAGNFVIGCGVMVVPGTLNELSHSLDVTVPVAGQLIAVAALFMGFGAPLLAGVVSGWDRRRLLAAALVWYALGHGLSALAPNYAALLPIRALTVLSAAVFTPQAAATAGFLARPQERGRTITFIFMGWSLASVIGMPIAAWVSAHLGWRMAMGSVAVASALAAAWVWRAVPDGVRPPALSLRAWKGVLTQPVLMGIVLVTALQSSGQYTVMAYSAPYFSQVLHASPEQMSLIFFWIGACGLVGNLVLNRKVDKVGPAWAVSVSIALVMLGQLLWPLAGSTGTMLLAILPWALGGFATNSAQQARLGGLAPALAPALMALNTSAIYLGHAVGAAGGGALLAAHGYEPLHWAGLGWLSLAWLVSWAAWRRQHTLAPKCAQAA